MSITPEDIERNPILKYLTPAQLRGQEPVRLPITPPGEYYNGSTPITLFSTEGSEDTNFVPDIAVGESKESSYGTSVGLSTEVNPPNPKGVAIAERVDEVLRARSLQIQENTNH